MPRGNRVYLDYAAATPIDKRVSRAMQEAEQKGWGNASSLHHEGGMAKEILENARMEMARILRCRKSEIVFTGGGTEGCNLAILGVVKAMKEKWPHYAKASRGKKEGKIPHIITSTIEHPAVLGPIKDLLKRREVEASFIAPNTEGIISPQSVERELKENTILVCIMHSNNEIGTIQPVRKIRGVIESANWRTSKPYLLVDASQSVCYEDISIERLGADILVLDGIKMYGPRGAGILVAKQNVAMAPIVFGGGQEGGLRSGTENAVVAVGLAEALKICEATREKESKRLETLRDYAILKILTKISGASLNGSQQTRLPNNINICFASPKHSAQVGRETDSEFLVIKLDTLGFAVSAASACNSLNLENSSYVIESLGKPECASSSLRFTLGRATRKRDLDNLVSTLKKILK